MTEELDRLWLLHRLDEDVAAIQGKLAQFPERRQALERAVAAERARLEAHQASNLTLQKQRREIEREIEAVDVQEKKYLSQQAAVKTNAEFQALTHEISGAKAKRSDLETRVLTLMEDEERNAAAQPKIEQALRATETERTEQGRTMQAEESAMAGAAGVLEARREAALAGLSAATRQRYERIHASLSGRAVVPIAKGACGGCYRALPPQMQMEAKKRDRLLICEGCGRILVLPPDAPA